MTIPFSYPVVQNNRNQIEMINLLVVKREPSRRTPGMYQRKINFKYYCTMCDERFCFPTMYQAHLNLHTHNKPYACSICKRRKFTTLYNLSSHESLCTEIPKWKCKKCRAIFTDFSLYAKHKQQGHKTGETFGQELLCSICGMFLLDLTGHMRKCHAKERKFICEVCGKTFPVKEYLVRHQDQHKQEKYVCEICGKSYTHRTNFALHNSAHHKTVSCERCSESMTVSVFKEHKKLCGQSIDEFLLFKRKNGGGKTKKRCKS